MSSKSWFIITWHDFDQNGKEYFYQQAKSINLYTGDIMSVLDSRIVSIVPWDAKDAVKIADTCNKIYESKNCCMTSLTGFNSSRRKFEHDYNN